MNAQTESSALARAFAALSPDFTFLPNAAMRPVVQDYLKEDKHDWRVNHLPMAVGRANPELLDEINSIASLGTFFGHRIYKAHKTELFLDIPRSSHLPNAEELTPQISSRISQYAPLRYRHALATTFAKIASGIIAQDCYWFGAKHGPIHIQGDHEIVDSNHGRHVYATGRPHRDYPCREANTGNRVYFFRSKFPTEFFANKLTENVSTDHIGAAVTGQKLLDFADGDVILANEGAKGAVHYSRRPTARKPSILMRVSICSTPEW